MIVLAITPTQFIGADGEKNDTDRQKCTAASDPEDHERKTEDHKR